MTCAFASESTLPVWLTVEWRYCKMLDRNLPEMIVVSDIESHLGKLHISIKGIACTLIDSLLRKLPSNTGRGRMDSHPSLAKHTRRNLTGFFFRFFCPQVRAFVICFLSFWSAFATSQESNSLGDKYFVEMIGTQPIVHDDEGLKGPYPHIPEGLFDVTEVEGSVHVTCFIASGDLLCRQNNSGTNVDSQPPGFEILTDMPEFAEPVLDVELSLVSEFACAITTNLLYCWGSNRIDDRFPIEMEGLTSLSVSGPEVCVVANNELICTQTAGLLIEGEPQVLGSGFLKVGATDFMSPQLCGIKLDGSVECFRGPSPPVGISNAIAFSDGQEHLCVHNDEDVFCWGTKDSQGRLAAPEFDNPISISSGTLTSCGLDAKDTGIELKCWGPNASASIAELKFNEQSGVVSVDSQRTTSPNWTWTSQTGTGIYRYQLGDSSLANPSDEVSDSKLNLPALPDGKYALYVQEKNSAGQFVNIGFATTLVDGTPPLASVDRISQNPGEDAFLVQLSCSDSIFDSNCEVLYSLDGTTNFSVADAQVEVRVNGGQRLTYAARDPLGNQSVPTLLKAEVSSDLFFQLTSRSILQDGVLNADGRLESGSNSVAVSGLTVALDIKIPSGFVISNVMSTTTDGTGAYSFSNIQDRLRPSPGADIPSGTYVLTARFTGTSQLQASTANPQTVLVGRTAGYALIVQGRVAGGEGEAAHKKTADRVYDTLIARGFDTENIVYLGYGGDVRQNGTPSLSGIESSMNTLGSRMESSPAPFYLVLVDHGTGGLFSVSESEQLTPDLLKRYVESLESAAQISSTSRDKERVLILGYCYSGEFIDDLAATGRVVVASAASNEESYKGVLEEDGVRSGEYFLEELFNELGRERDLRSAFIEATIKTERFTRRNQAAETRPPFFDAALQHPLLEDSAGDGVLGSNLLTEGFGDGILASTLFLGVEGDTNAVPLAFTNIAPTRYLASGASTLATTDLYAKVNDNNQVRSSVRLELRSPTQTLSEPDAARGASEQKEISNAASQIRTVLSTTADADGTLRWNVSPADAGQLSFVDRGRYEVYYHVLDKQTPPQAAPVEVGVVYKTYDGNQPPAAFNLVEPASGASVRTEDVFIWRETTDPDDLNNVLNVSYNLVISVDQSFANDPRFQNIAPARGQFFIAEGIQFGTYAVGREAGLVDGQTYFWKVEAVDGFGAIRTSEVRSFTADNRNALAGPDLLVRQVVSNQRGFTGVGIPLTFEVTNLSVVADKVATHVELTSRISDNFTVSGLSPVCTESSRLIRCQLSDIGSQETELLVARLTPSREGQGTVKTIVTGHLDAGRTQRQPDENLANNVSTTQFIIGASLDSDGDGLPDIYEQENGLNPGVNDAGSDNDGDGRTNLVEFQQGTNPNQADTATAQTNTGSPPAGSGIPVKLDASKTLSLQVVNQPLLSPTGGSLTVPANATAVSLNVTVVTPERDGFVTVYPCGVTRPNASNVNYVAGQVVPNGVIAPVGADGKVCFYSNSETDLIVDIAGYFVGESFTGATPQRLIDSRDGSNNPQVSPANPVVLTIANLASQTSAGASTTVPSDVKAAALNVTVVNPAEAGFVTVYPCDAPRPNASNVNYAKGQIVANGVIAPVSANGQVCVYSNQPIDVIVDLAGWFRGNEFKGAAPKRLVDTRDGTGGQQGQLGASGQYGVLVVGQTLTVDGASQLIPSSATAVALNVTVTNPQEAGFITVYPCSAERPNASNVNYVAGDTVANNVIAPIGSSGFVCVYTQSTTDVIVDISGWFEGTSTNGFIATNPARLVDTRDGTGPAPR
jgi:hypothetical protein